MSTPSKRDPFIDGIRGLLLLIMAVDHALFFLFPKLALFKTITFESLGFFSAAEGFYFLAGVSAGLAYYPKLLADGTAAVRSRLFTRVRKIYLVQILLLVLAWAIAPAFWNDNTYQLLVNQPAKALLRGVLLLYQPSILDVLPLYIVFLGVTPWLLRAIQRGWQERIALASLGLWIGAQTHYFQHDHHVIDFGYFNIFAWQLLYIAGLLAVTSRYRVAQWTEKWLGCIWLAFVAGLAVRHAVDVSRLPKIIGWGTNRSFLGLFRLLDCLAIFVLVARLRPYFSKALSLPVLDVLPLLGRHSLAVFAWHMGGLYLLSRVHNPFPIHGTVFQTAVLCGFALSMVIPARVSAWYDRWKCTISTDPPASALSGLPPVAPLSHQKSPCR